VREVTGGVLCGVLGGGETPEEELKDHLAIGGMCPLMAGSRCEGDLNIEIEWVHALEDRFDTWGKLRGMRLCLTENARAG